MQQGQSRGLFVVELATDVAQGGVTHGIVSFRRHNRLRSVRSSSASMNLVAFDVKDAVAGSGGAGKRG